MEESLKVLPETVVVEESYLPVIEASRQTGAWNME